MMNYELFKEVVAEKFKDYMPVGYTNYKLDIHKVDKVNQTLDAMNLIPDGNEKLKTTPSIYLNNMYEHYKECEDLQEVLQEAAKTMDRVFKEAPEIAPKVDFDNAKDNVVMALINTEQNKELLKNVPNREFQDLSIVYRWVVSVEAEGISSSIVNNDLAEKLGMSEEALYNAAVENTKRIFPPSVKSMDDVIRDMFIKDGMPGEVADIMIGETSGLWERASGTAFKTGN